MTSPNKLTPAQKAESLRNQAQDLQFQADLWDMVEEAVEMHDKPDRNRVIVEIKAPKGDQPGEYVATHRWEINPDNGYITVQLRDGSIMPFPLGKWALDDWRYHLRIESDKDIVIDDPRPSRQNA